MFTLTDIKNIAIQIEQNGRETYLKASQMIKDREIAALLKRMADDEQRHEDWFSALPETKLNASAEEREMEIAGKAILQDIVRDRTFSLDADDLASVATVEELLEQAQAFEDDTVLFYEMLLSVVDDEAVSAQLEDVIEEERRHSAELLELFGK